MVQRMQNLQSSDRVDDFESLSQLSSWNLRRGRRYFWLAFCIGMLAIIICGWKGYWAYHQSRESLLETIEAHNEEVASFLAKHDNLELEGSQLVDSPAEYAEGFVQRWRQLPGIRTNSYLYVIGSDGRIAAHSARPERVGADVSSVTLGDGTRSHTRTVAQLLGNGQDWVGENTNLHGKRQIAAYAYSDHFHGLVVVHTPAAEYDGELWSAQRPWVVSYCIAVFGLWPMCMLLAHLGFRRYHALLVNADRRMQAQLSELEHIYDTAPVGLCLVDKQLRFLRINKELARIHGRSVKQHFGIRLRSVIPELADRIEPIIQQVLESETPIRDQEIVRHDPDSEAGPGHYLASFHPLRNYRGSVIGVGAVLQDITERKKTENALAKSETLYRTVVENSYDIINLFSADGRVLYNSPSIRRVLGYEPEERLNQRGTELIHPDDLQNAVAEFQEYINLPGDVGHFTYRLRHKDGTYRIVEVTGTNLLHVPEVKAMLSIVRDVTNKKQAENALRQSEQRFRALCTHVPVGIFMTDRDGNCIFVNQQGREIVGDAEDRIRQRGWIAYLHEDDRDDVIQKWEHHISNRSNFSCDCKFRTATDRIVWIDCNCVPLFDQQGEYLGSIGMMVDITARVHYQRQLEESENRYRTLVENAPEAIVVFDVDQMRFVDANENALRLFDVDMQTIKSLSPIDLSPPKQPNGQYSRQAALHFIQQAVDGFTPKFEWLHWDIDGNPIECEVRLVRLPSSTNCLIRGSINDISERKWAEAAMREQQEQLTHVSRLSTMGEMVAGIAHEINQPLSSISNFAYACSRTLKLGRVDPRELLEWSGDILDEATRAAEIIKRLGNFTCKRHEGKITFDMNELVLDTLELVSFHATSRHVVTASLLTDEKLKIFADRIQIQQVLVNLLLNAHEATEELATDERLVQIKTRIEHNQVFVEVIDNGVGIPPGKSDSIFEAFVTTKPNGMGMGLAISRTIIQSHGGQLIGKPNRGRGSTFGFCLPVCHQQDSINSSQMVGQQNAIT